MRIDISRDDLPTLNKRFRALEMTVAAKDARIAFLSEQLDDLRARTNPELLESERRANAILTEELERSRAQQDAPTDAELPLEVRRAVVTAIVASWEAGKAFSARADNWQELNAAKEGAETDLRGLLADRQKRAQDGAFSQYSYQQIFNAIAAATKAEHGGPVGISVIDFRAALAAAKPEGGGHGA